MRMLIQATLPHDKFNAALRDGSASAKLKRILADLKPEAAYFTELRGRRCAILILDVEEPSRIPSVAEPFFLTFNADVEFHPIMSADELGRSGIDELAKKWG